MESRPLRFCAGLDSRWSVCVSRACFSKRKNCLLCGALSAKSALIPRLVSCSARRIGQSDFIPLGLPLFHRRTSVRPWIKWLATNSSLVPNRLFRRGITKSGAFSSSGFSQMKSRPPVLIECAFAWVLSIARHGTGIRLSPLRVEFVHTRSNIKALERHFGCPVVCGSARNAIVFRAGDAEREFVTRNAELLGLLAPQFEKELEQENADENFVERVRLAIQQKLTGRRPTIEDIADALHISSRTLQRRLQDEDSSFQRVLEEARHQLARHFLNNSVLELNEAAYLLGYEDGNSFVRAFRSWEGVPPARWREMQRPSAVS